MRTASVSDNVRFWAGPALLLICLVAGCSSGINHIVRRGENLYRIGKAYGFSYPELARINHINPPYTLKIGQKVFVPGADHQLPVRIITPSAVERVRRAGKGNSKKTAPRTNRQSRQPSPAKVTQPRGLAPGSFRWPLAGMILSPFGPRQNGHHDGVDIQAPAGTKVAAARSGRVIFADRLSGYGNVIIIEHAGGFTTVYAHNQKNLVGKGESVIRGKPVAYVGSTGRTEGTHLHFEIRRNNIARDPVQYLPKR